MSYTHLLYHIVFATKDRMPLIAESWETELHRYLGGIINGQGGEAIEINGTPEHVHVLTRLKPLPAIPDFMRELKASSSKWATPTAEILLAAALRSVHGKRIDVRRGP